jgi:hypothetical protein
MVYEKTRAAFARHGLHTANVLQNGVSAESYRVVVADGKGGFLINNGDFVFEDRPYPTDEAATDIYHTWLEERNGDAGLA